MIPNAPAPFAAVREAGYEQLLPLVWSSAETAILPARLEFAVIRHGKKRHSADIVERSTRCGLPIRKSCNAGNIGHFTPSGADYADPEH